MKKICVIVGARPNFVKVAPIIRVARQQADVECLLVYAGRRDDPTLESSLFADLQMPEPDVCLGVDSDRLNEITSRVMAEFDRLLDEHPVDVVIVVDDLASTMAAAIVTKKRGIRLAHLVAGTRSFDITMPKEINRLVIDALSDYLFTAGVKSTGVATREQSEASHTYLVGNILMDTLRMNRDRLRQPAVVDGRRIVDQQYAVFTLNRRALLADEPLLRRMLTEMVSVGWEIVAPLRGEARKVVTRQLEAMAADGLSTDRFHLVDPLSYLEFGWLTAHARVIVTDSGNVAEEATFNGIPCITLNSYTEHQETVSVGTNVLVGEDADRLRQALATLQRGEWKKCALPDRWDGRTAERIVQILISE